MLYDDLPFQHRTPFTAAQPATVTPDERAMPTPQELKEIVSEGLLSFPVTDFDQNGDFNAKTYAARLEWLAPYGATALFAAGGTGEFFSLAPQEYSDVAQAAPPAPPSPTPRKPSAKAPRASCCCPTT
ncbi:hypothetical protein G6F40_016341 [Rhizopus arrhizus]|nr:hypothetical protein G6F40_016341 [Rhizopus arrhizus]